ncbi:MAG: hypothetical protein LUH14_05925 [Clostridiaceae bacterium]|nr:hypothetical protein [Clostridiaceae bacterium]
MHYLVFQFPEIYYWSEDMGYGDDGHHIIREDIDFPIRPKYIDQEYAPDVIHAKNGIIDRIKKELCGKKEFKGYDFSFFAPYEPVTIESDFRCANMFDYEMLVMMTNLNKCIAPHRHVTKYIYYGLIETER